MELTNKKTSINTIMDKESTALSSFFRTLNQTLLILNIILSFPLAYYTGVSYQEYKEEQAYLSHYNPNSDEADDSYNTHSQNDTEYNDLVLFIVLMISLFMSIFFYAFNLLFIKHFSNLAELKQIRKIEYMNSQQNI
ncbi:hypothetical protein [Vagococcus bubulae]|uniref:Uncharacterized protein n=1 Tax=Vagococcus bubulae TaxID=1977868 RepID=A0A429ZA37_9ENTE|nr:hypothetical protein [Vagococcus bubulae]RST90587.1 hypothetical protein CBF36_11530 [Vagococcus bubulae]